MKTLKNNLCQHTTCLNRANLKWRLFKRHAITVGESYRRYKRPSGTRWVAHPSDALDSFLSNLACLLGYLHNQISDQSRLKLHNIWVKKSTTCFVLEKLVFILLYKWNV